MGERTPDISAGPPWLRPEALIELIDELREAGYHIGVSQYVAAQDLILALIARGENLDRPWRLGSLLRPLLCSSPTEQEEFEQRFERWIERMGFPASAAAPKSSRAEALERELEAIGRRSRGWRWAGLAAIIVLVVVLIVLLHPSFPRLRPAPTPTATPGQLPVFTPAPEPAGPTPTPEPQRATAPWASQKVLGLSLLVPSVALLAWRLWLFYRVHLFLARNVTDRQPDIARVSIPGLSEALFPELLFLRIAQGLRRRIEVPSNELDVGRTVQETVSRGGWFEPVYARRQVLPEYVVLVDRASYGDHQARFVQEMITCLQGNQVFLTGYYFDGDPRLCLPMAGEGPPQTLFQVAARYGQHRLLIFSDAEGLFSARSGDLEPWIDVFLTWPDRALLTPEPVERWGYRESELSQQFIVLPATAEGLVALVPSIGRGESSYRPAGRFSLPVPEPLRERPQRWIERDPPDPALVDQVLASLRRYLGPKGFCWLCACAVYPEMHWDLTLYLGNALLAGHEPQRLLLYRLSTLARLPWFQHGYMPDWLRTRLISELPRPQERNIRTALQALLIGAAQGPADGLQLEIAQTHRRALSALIKPLLRTLSRGAEQDSPLKDHVFLNFMLGRRRKRLAVRVPEALRKLIARRPRVAVALPVAALLIAIVALSYRYVWLNFVSTGFDYQVHVREKATGENLQGAAVTIEVGGKAPLDDVTDSEGLARIRVPSSFIGQIGRLIIEAAGYQRYEQHIDLYKDALPDIVQLEPATPTPTFTPTLTHTLIIMPSPTNTVPPTPVPTTPVPTTPAPTTPVPTTQVPTTPVSITPAPTTPVPTAPAPTPIPQARVIGDAVNIRSGPGTVGYEVIAVAREGDTFTIVGRNDDASWWQICCVQSQKAWIYANWVEVGGPISEVPVVSTPTPAPTRTPRDIWDIVNISPSNYSEVPYGKPVILVWTWNGDLKEDGIFSVRVWRKTGRQGVHIVHASVREPLYVFDPSLAPYEREFCWNVQAVKPDGEGGWIALSQNSEPSCFSIEPMPTPRPGR